MLEAGTKGGPIPLEATSHQLSFIMDIAVGNIPRKHTLRVVAEQAPSEAINGKYHMLWSLIELDRIARKYLFDTVSTRLMRITETYAHTHAPLALAFACQQSPPHGSVARCALRAFEDDMPSWMIDYFDPCEPVYVHSGVTSTPSRLSPALRSMTKSFAKSLGAEALLAYAKAMDRAICIAESKDEEDNDRSSGTDTGETERAKTESWDWCLVAQTFVEEMEIEHQEQPLMDGSDSESEPDERIDYDDDYDEDHPEASEVEYDDYDDMDRNSPSEV
jgi:hypothetical protein